jgi:hypothetical protein
MKKPANDNDTTFDGNDSNSVVESSEEKTPTPAIPVSKRSTVRFMMRMYIFVIRPSWF